MCSRVRALRSVVSQTTPRSVVTSPLPVAGATVTQSYEAKAHPFRGGMKPTASETVLLSVVTPSPRYGYVPLAGGGDEARHPGLGPHWHGPRPHRRCVGTRPPWGTRSVARNPTSSVMRGCQVHKPFVAVRRLETIYTPRFFAGFGCPVDDPPSPASRSGRLRIDVPRNRRFLVCGRIAAIRQRPQNRTAVLMCERELRSRQRLRRLRSLWIPSRNP
jgi:hypothetical protein